MEGVRNCGTQPSATLNSLYHLARQWVRAVSIGHGGSMHMQFVLIEQAILNTEGSLKWFKPVLSPSGSRNSVSTFPWNSLAITATYNAQGISVGCSDKLQALTPRPPSPSLSSSPKLPILCSRAGPPGAASNLCDMSRSYKKREPTLHLLFVCHNTVICGSLLASEGYGACHWWFSCNLLLF